MQKCKKNKNFKTFLYSCSGYPYHHILLSPSSLVFVLVFFFKQRTATIQDLEEQLKKHHEEVGRSSPFSSSLSVHSQDGVQREIEILRLDKDRQDNETFILQRSLEELSARLEAQQQAMQAKDETITQLMGMIQSNKGVESKQMEMLKDHQSSDRKKLTEALNQLAKLREVIDERDRAIASLKEVHNLQVEKSLGSVQLLV